MGLTKIGKYLGTLPDVMTIEEVQNTLSIENASDYSTSPMNEGVYIEVSSMTESPCIITVLESGNTIENAYLESITMGEASYFIVNGEKFYGTIENVLLNEPLKIYMYDGLMNGLFIKATKKRQKFISGHMTVQKMQNIYDDAMKVEYDRFWDNYQNKGNRTNYMYGFSGIGWNNEIFKPKYIINCVNSTSNMFMGASITNLDTSKLDTSKVTNFSYMFNGSTTRNKIQHIGSLDMTSAVNINWMFNYCTDLISIELLKFPEDYNQITSADKAFDNCNNLKEIRFQGEIGVNIDFHYCKNLSAESLESILYHLTIYKEGNTVVFPSNAESTYNARFGEGEWVKVTSYRGNWSIAYA